MKIMNKALYCITTLFISVGLTSCASLFTGTSDNITFNSEPKGARILIEGIDYGRTPATVSVKRPGLSDKQVTFQLEGYEDRVFTLQKEFNVVSILNLAGLLGWVVDIATGAVMKYNPRSYNMELRPEGTSYNIQDLPRDLQGSYIVPSEKNRVFVTDKQTGLMMVFEK